MKEGGNSNIERRWQSQAARIDMGVCQSTESEKSTPVVDLADGDDTCPTVFELERSIEEKRRASQRLHENLINIEFHQGLFEIYDKGARIPTRSESTNMFVATHKVRI